MLTASTCTPTRAAIFTGRGVNAVGLQDGPFVPGEGGVVTHDFPFLPELLKDEGYRTVGLGKWHLGFTSVVDLPNSRGFDKFFGNLQGAGDFYTHEIGLLCNSQNPVNPDSFPGSYGSNCYSINGYDLVYNGEPVLEDASGSAYRGQYYTDVLATKATEYIDEHDPESPLFLYLAPTAPHAPMQATEEYMALCEHITTDNYRNILCGMMAGVDAMVGKVVAALAAKGMLENTVIAYTSDNGGVSIFGSNNLYRGDKGAAFDGGVRVPAFISSPNLQSKLRGQTYDGLVHANDFFATLARAGGIDKTVIAASEGFPFLHQGLNKIDKDFDRNVVYLGLAGPLYGNTGGAVFKHNDRFYKWMRFPSGFAYFAGYSTEFQRGVTDGDYLFDLTADPQETTNQVNNPAYASMVEKGRTYAITNMNAGKPSQTTPRFFTEKPTDKGCWLPRDSPHRAIDCGIAVVNAVPNLTPAPYPFLPSMNQLIYQNAGRVFQTAFTAAQTALLQLIVSTSALLMNDNAPCTPERAAARGATAVALGNLQVGVAVLQTLTAGTASFVQQQTVVQGLVGLFVQKLSLYLADNACGGAGLATNVAAAQVAVATAQGGYFVAAAGALAAQANFVAEGNICGCACGINCPTVTLASTSVSSHEHPDFRISSENIMAGKSIAGLFHD